MARETVDILASVGVSTAFIDVVPPQRPDEGHIYLMFDTEVPAKQASVVSENPKRYVVRKNEVEGRGDDVDSC